MSLAEKLLALRTERGLSQGDLAEKLEVSRQSVSKWETGQSVPDLEKIIKLADLFGVSVDDLVREEARPEPQVVYVEKKQRLNGVQILGLVVIGFGIYNTVGGLIASPLLGLVGLIYILPGLVLLRAKKHPVLVLGWLLAIISFLSAAFRAITLGAPHWSLIAAILYGMNEGHFGFYILEPLVRDILILILAVCTWRTVRKPKP